MAYLHMKIPYFLKKEINEVYIMHSVRSFAISTVTVFVPVFLLQQGMELLQVAFYFGVYSLLNIVFSLLGVLYASRKGVKHTIVMSFPVLILFFILLYQTETLLQYMPEYSLLSLYALIYSFAMSFYFMGFHIEFSKFSSKKKRYADVGKVRALATFGSVMGPLLGGTLIGLIGFQAMFSIVACLLLLSVLPLFLNKEIYQPFNLKLKNCFSKPKHALPFLAEGFRFMTARYFWPVLLFLIGLSLSQLGGLFSFSSALLALFTIYLGKKTNEVNKHKILLVGVVTNALSMVGRAFLQTISLIAIVQGVGGLTWTFVQVPYYSMFYSASYKEGIAETVFIRELFLNIGKLLSTALLVVLLLFSVPSTTALISVIVAGAIMMLLMLKISDDK